MRAQRGAQSGDTEQSGGAELSPERRGCPEQSSEPEREPRVRAQRARIHSKSMERQHKATVATGSSPAAESARNRERPPKETGPGAPDSGREREKRLAGTAAQNAGAGGTDS